jgi:16S rRNA (uracil1498-N3)-methyltransferase
VTTVLPILPLADWLQEEGLHGTGGMGGKAGRDVVLSFDAAALAPSDALAGTVSPVRVLSGPEGGLTAAEERAALSHGFVPVGLGPRVLRADTAPLALLSWLGLQRMKAAG